MLPWALSARDSRSIQSGSNFIPFERAEKGPGGRRSSRRSDGYQGVEFYAPSFEWTESQTKQMRNLLDDLGTVVSRHTTIVRI